MAVSWPPAAAARQQSVSNHLWTILPILLASCWSSACSSRDTQSWRRRSPAGAAAVGGAAAGQGRPTGCAQSPPLYKLRRQSTAWSAGTAGCP